MKRFLAIGCAFGAGIFAGCGGSEDAGSSAPPVDAGSNDSSAGGSSAGSGGGFPGGAGGSGGSGGSSAADAGSRWDGGVQPTTLLHAGDEIELHGVTADGYVIYFSGADGSLRAVPYWGGPSEVIFPGHPRVTIHDRVVYTAPTAASSVPFTVWRHGMKPLRITGGPVANSVYSVDDAAVVDPAGERIVFTRDVGGVLHWIGANIDLTGEVDLAVAGTGSCAKVFHAAGHFVTTSCPITGTYELDSWGPSWTRTSYHSGPGLRLNYDGVQVAGERVVYAGEQVLEWARPGGAATTLATGVYDFLVSADGQWVAYRGSSGANVSAIAPWAPAPLEISPTDGRNVTFSADNAFIASDGDYGTASYASVANGRRIELTPGVDSDLLDRGFTRDSRYVLAAAEDRGLFAVPVDGKPPVQLAPLRSFITPRLVAARGARVAYVHHETGQLLLRDLDSTAPAVVLSDGVDYTGPLGRALVTTPEGDSVVYVVNAGDAGVRQGLYAVGVP